MNGCTPIILPRDNFFSSRQRKDFPAALHQTRAVRDYEVVMKKRDRSREIPELTGITL